jgi:hypothetical protein
VEARYLRRLPPLEDRPDEEDREEEPELREDEEELRDEELELREGAE